MAMPAVKALAEALDVQLTGPAWTGELYRTGQALRPGEKPRPADGVVLFKPSFRAAWRHRGYARRIGLAVNRRRWLLTDPVEPGGGHRADDYTALAGVLLDFEPGLPSYAPPPCTHPALQKDDVLLIVGTASPETVRWQGFRELAEQVGRDRAVFAGGPGDEEAVEVLGRGYRRLPTDLGIAQFARASQGAGRVVGLDSGLTHLAAAARRAAGIPGETTAVVYGSTAPEQTGPQGSLAVLGKAPPCWPCYAKTCRIQTPCLGTPAKQVIECALS
jgi:ADP-heptose:LPS heptosyltransferase